MNAREKWDLPEVAEKRANKAASAAAEHVERRGGAKENAELQSTVRTQSRAAVSQAQSRIREAVIRNRRDKLTALLHHLTVDVLRESFFGLKKSAAPGVDGPSTRRASMRTSRTSIHASKQEHIERCHRVDLYSEAGWQAAAARHRCSGGQDRPGGGGGNPDADL